MVFLVARVHGAVKGILGGAFAGGDSSIHCLNQLTWSNPVMCPPNTLMIIEVTPAPTAPTVYGNSWSGRSDPVTDGCLPDPVPESPIDEVQNPVVCRR